MSLAVTLVSSAGFHLGVGYPTREATSRRLSHRISYPSSGNRTTTYGFHARIRRLHDSTWRTTQNRARWEPRPDVLCTEEGRPVWDVDCRSHGVDDTQAPERVLNPGPSIIRQDVRPWGGGADPGMSEDFPTIPLSGSWGGKLRAGKSCASAEPYFWPTSCTRACCTRCLFQSSASHQRTHLRDSRLSSLCHMLTGEHQHPISRRRSIMEAWRRRMTQ